jgi:hypothetical protein
LNRRLELGAVHERRGPVVPVPADQ